MFKRSLGLYPHPLVECIVNVQPDFCSNSGNVAAEKGYDHVSASLEYPRGGRSEIDRDPEGQLRDIAGMLALSCWKRKLFFNSLINL